MADTALSALDLVDVIREDLGSSASQVRAHKDGSVRFVLFDALAVAARPDDYGSGGNWGFGLILGGDVEVSTLMGVKLTLRSTRDEIGSALATLDSYARLRLGVDYVAAFEASRPAARG